MPDDTSEHPEIQAWLREEGYSAEDIGKILAKIQEMDALTLLDSAMESIEAGRFDIEGIIKKALGEASD